MTFPFLHSLPTSFPLLPPLPLSREKVGEDVRGICAICKFWGCSEIVTMVLEWCCFFSLCRILWHKSHSICRDIWLPYHTGKQTEPKDKHYVDRWPILFCYFSYFVAFICLLIYYCWMLVLLSTCPVPFSSVGEEQILSWFFYAWLKVQLHLSFSFPASQPASFSRFSKLSPNLFMDSCVMFLIFQFKVLLIMVIRRSLNLVNTEQKSSFKQTKERAQAKKHKQISQLKRNFGPTKKLTILNNNMLAGL